MPIAGKLSHLHLTSLSAQTWRLGLQIGWSCGSTKEKSPYHNATTPTDSENERLDQGVIGGFITPCLD